MNKICPGCGARGFHALARYCPGCGGALPVAPPQGSGARARLIGQVAAALALALGLGVVVGMRLAGRPEGALRTRVSQSWPAPSAPASGAVWRAAPVPAGPSGPGAPAVPDTTAPHTVSADTTAPAPSEILPPKQELPIPDARVPDFQEDDPDVEVRAGPRSGPPSRPESERPRPARPRPRKRMVMATSPVMLPGLTAIRAGLEIPVRLEETQRVTDLKAGDTFTFAVLTAPSEPDFGNLSEASEFPAGSRIEMEVVGARRPQEGDPGMVIFRPCYLLLPFKSDTDMAIPIVASLQKPGRGLPNAFDQESMARAGNEWGSNLGQVLHGTDGYFNGGAWGWLLGRSMGYWLEKQPSYFRGVMRRDTPAVVRINRRTVY